MAHHAGNETTAAPLRHLLPFFFFFLFSGLRSEEADSPPPPLLSHSLMILARGARWRRAWPLRSDSDRLSTSDVPVTAPDFTKPKREERAEKE